jgi:putative mycofactocin binding protein MftB
MKRYVLHPDCRVRKEKFGLLFYDLKGPKLLFAETGDLLAPELFRGGGDMETALAGRSCAELARVERLLQSLSAKGFICEQSLC